MDRPLAGYPEDLSDEDLAVVGEAIPLGNPLPAHSEKQPYFVEVVPLLDRVQGFTIPGGPTCCSYFGRDPQDLAHVEVGRVVQVVVGEGAFIIAGEMQKVKEGEMIIMPANIPHAVKATERFKMLLTMLK